MDTDKFIEAQKPISNIVLSELRSGRKKLTGFGLFFLNSKNWDKVIWQFTLV